MHTKKTKIVCTIGPSSWDFDTLVKLIENGMDVARLNLSHGSHEEKAEQIRNIREAAKKVGNPVAIMADLQGPKLRLGTIEGTKGIAEDDTIKLSATKQGDDITPMQIDISTYVKPGDRIFLNDGLVELTVGAVADGVITAKALNNGWISSNKGVNIPDSIFTAPVFTEKDQEDAEFAIKQGVEYLALSFIQRPEDLMPAKEMLSRFGAKTRIIVKVEKKEATKHLEEIIKLSDAVMVARGDLAIEAGARIVPIVQQKMLRIARQYQKPLIVATQMLVSMVQNPRPTRAEASDVANAVLDQVDAVMLSDETANGNYPVETVRTMHDIINTVEENPEFKTHIPVTGKDVSTENQTSSAIVHAAEQLAETIKAKKIVVATATGRTAQLLASYRPSARIFAITHDEIVRQQLSLVWGVESDIISPLESFDDFLREMIAMVSNRGHLHKGDKIVVVTGTSVGTAGGTDTIKVITL